MQKHIQELQEKGYTVVPNVLSKDEVEEALSLFKAWQKTIPNHDTIHRKCDPHGIYKHHEAGHQEHLFSGDVRQGRGVPRGLHLVLVVEHAEPARGQARLLQLGHEGVPQEPLVAAVLGGAALQEGGAVAGTTSRSRRGRG